MSIHPFRFLLFHAKFFIVYPFLEKINCSYGKLSHTLNEKLENAWGRKDRKKT